MKRWLTIIGLLLLAALTLPGCKFLWWGGSDEDKLEHVMIMYSAGKNNLSGFLTSDIATLKSSKLPSRHGKEALVLVAHNNYGSACIVRMFEKKGANYMDTLKTFDSNLFLTQKEVMREALTFVKDTYPASVYGMVFSSHATGWLPEAYYSSGSDDVIFLSPSRRSIGQEGGYVNGKSVSYELSLADFRDAIPMRLEYLLFDACLMGTVEVAYGLRDVCHYIGFSPTEVLSEGFDYSELTADVFNNTPRDAVKAVCDHFVAQYEDKTGWDHSANAAGVDCNSMSSLATVCRSLCAKYADQIAALGTTGSNTPQKYFGGSKHWFYDLEDIFVKAGITDAEYGQLQSALGSCVYYKSTTGQYSSSIDGETHPIDTYSGLSMYLPSMGSEALDTYYKTLDWNKATGLVK
mgnify:CR=1 FL=1